MIYYLSFIQTCTSKTILDSNKTLLNNQIICGIKITKNTSKETKYLKSNFFDFLKILNMQTINLLRLINI